MEFLAILRERWTADDYVCAISIVVDYYFLVVVNHQKSSFDMGLRPKHWKIMRRRVHVNNCADY